MGVAAQVEQRVARQAASHLMAVLYIEGKDTTDCRLATREKYIYESWRASALSSFANGD